MKLTAHRNKGVSELYASLLMIGVTLSFGSVVTVAAVNQFSQSGNTGSLAATVQQASEGKAVAFVYFAVASGSGSPACSSTYQGVTEGKSSTLALYNYGTAGMNPTEVFVNGTLVYSGTGFGNIPPGALTTLGISLTSCAHQVGQTILLVDSHGDEVQFGT